MSQGAENPVKASNSELGEALGACRAAFIGLGMMTSVINVLYLTGSLFMLEVYDRVLPSRSMPTLAALALAAGFAYLAQGFLEVLRSRLLLRIGGSLDAALSGRIFGIVIKLPLHTRGGDGARSIRDLDQIRSFTSSIGPAALFDLPWIPVYLGICFLFHPLIGIAAVAGGVILVGLTLLTDYLTRPLVQAVSHHAGHRNGLAEAARGNAEVLKVMGMAAPISDLWARSNDKYIDSQQRVADISSGFSIGSKVLRLLLQSAVLAIGAYLVVTEQASAGIMIASSILVSRALAPVELAIANWKGFVAARQSWYRLRELLRLVPAEGTPIDLPTPQRSLTAEQVSVVPPGSRTMVVNGVSFGLTAGQGLGIIGPSGSGKSCLVRALVGAWQPAKGIVRLDGAALHNWSAHQLGSNLGYVPQNVDLFAGTVAQNVARFQSDYVAEDVIAASKAAGVHELIMRLPQGYETQIGTAGQELSAGQRQRIGLARALFGSPFLIVLDEPNSNLDAEGEEALKDAIMQARSRGAIVVIVAHRPSILACVDLVLVMRDGRAQAFGSRNEVLEKLTRRPIPLSAPPNAKELRLVPEAARS